MSGSHRPKFVFFEWFGRTFVFKLCGKVSAVPFPQLEIKWEICTALARVYGSTLVKEEESYRIHVCVFVLLPTQLRGNGQPTNRSSFANVKNWIYLLQNQIGWFILFCIWLWILSVTTLRPLRHIGFLMLFNFVLVIPDRSRQSQGSQATD